MRIILPGSKQLNSVPKIWPYFSVGDN